VASSTTALNAQTPLPGIVVVVEGASRAVKPVPRAPAPALAASDDASASDAASAAAASTAAAEAADAGTAGSNGPTFSSLGTSATVITGADLARHQVQSPAEALRGVPGVAVSQTGSPAGVTQVRIRGAEGNHTLVLVDGIEANSPADGEFDFSNLVGTEDIERIEVLRGVQSGLYGSGAIGGVVNIVTPSGKGPLRVTGKVEGGSFGTKTGGAVISGGNDLAWGLASVQTRKIGGFNIAPIGDEKDGSQTTSSLLKGGIRPFENLTIEGVLRQTNKIGQRDEENYFIPGVLVQQTDAPSHFSADLWLGSVEAKLSLLGDAWLHSVRLEKRSLTADDFSANPAFAPFTLYDKYRSETDLMRYTSTYRFDLPGLPLRHYVTGLIEQRDDSFILYTDDNRDHTRRMLSFAGELRGEYWKMLDVIASLRRDDSDVFQDTTTWRTSASLKIPSTPLRLHASAGTAVKMPSLFEQFGRIPNFFVSNPNLVPEQAKGWDSGVEISLWQSKAIFDVTWFNTELRNKITRINGGMTVDNIEGVSTREGLELSGKVVPFAGLTLAASYTWLQAREPSGRPELRRPDNTARIDADYQFANGRALIGVSAIYNGDMIDEALRTANPFIFPLTPERVTLDSYWLLSARAAYKVTPNMEVFGRLENALDTKYQEIYGFQTAGFAAYAGVKVTFGP
jgi:vitamin B12 transporter